MRRPIPLSNMLKSSSSSFRQHSIRPLPTHPFVASLPRASHFRMSSQFTLRKVAAPNTLDHRIYVEKDGSPVSIFHDIPLRSNKDENVFNMVVEIPRWTNPKLEISRDELLNPIKQDTKNGKLRFVRNRFPHKGYIWNYGALPQTWEDPNVVNADTGAKGDNDPLDALEIGERVSHVGEIKQVKALGVMGLLDDGETDWKILVIDIKDPLADKLNDIDDINKHMPGLLPSTRDWFRFYKVPDGKPENKVAFGGKFKDRKYALHIIEECKEAWDRLITKKTPAGEVNIANLTVENSPARIKPQDLPELPPHEELEPHEIDKSIDKWFFLGEDKA